MAIAGLVRHHRYREFFWASSPTVQHSRNLAERPQAGVVIFDSRVPAGTAQAVYLTVTARGGDRRTADPGH